MERPIQFDAHNLEIYKTKIYAEMSSMIMSVQKENPERASILTSALITLISHADITIDFKVITTAATARTAFMEFVERCPQMPAEVREIFLANA